MCLEFGAVLIPTDPCAEAGAGKTSLLYFRKQRGHGEDWRAEEGQRPPDCLRVADEDLLHLQSGRTVCVWSPSLCVCSDTDLCFQLISGRIIVFTFRGTRPALKPTGDKLERVLIIILIHYTTLIAKATFPPTNTTQGKLSFISAPRRDVVIFFFPCFYNIKNISKCWVCYTKQGNCVNQFHCFTGQRDKKKKCEKTNTYQADGSSRWVANELLITKTHILYLESSSHTLTDTEHRCHVTREPDLPYLVALNNDQRRMNSASFEWMFYICCTLLFFFFLPSSVRSKVSPSFSSWRRSAPF